MRGPGWEECGMELGALDHIRTFHSYSFALICFFKYSHHNQLLLFNLHLRGRVSV